MSVADRGTEPRLSLTRLIVVGGLAVFALHLIWDVYLYTSVYLGFPIEVPLQFVTSGITGSSAFEGGWGTALVGLGIHLFISLVVAAVFIVAATRLPVLRRHPIIGGLAYGLVVLVVMTVVTLLSAAPPVERDVAYWASALGSHLLAVGLLLGVLVKWSRIGA